MEEKKRKNPHFIAFFWTFCTTSKPNATAATCAGNQTQQQQAVTSIPCPSKTTPHRGIHWCATSTSLASNSPFAAPKAAYKSPAFDCFPEGWPWKYLCSWHLEKSFTPVHKEQITVSSLILPHYITQEQHRHHHTLMPVVVSFNFIKLPM